MLSISSRAFLRPSRICALCSASDNSKVVLLIITSRLKSKKCPNTCLMFIILGTPFTRANIITPNVSCICVNLYRLLRIISAIASLLHSTTILFPSLSDSSLRSEIPSSFFSLTRSAIFSTRFALLT